MDGKWFSQAYEKRPINRKELDDERREALQPVFDWADSFSLAAHHILRGGTFSVGEAGQFIGDYSKWLNEDFAALTPGAMKLEMSHDGNNIGLINFHKMNADFLPIWWHIMNGSTGIPEETVRAVQNSVAAQGVLMMPAREEAVERNMYFGKEYDIFRNNFTGYLNEIDTAVDVLELTAEHPEIAVIPSPTQFLMTPDRGRNTNFIAINLQTKEAHGIQTRMSVSGRDMEDSDRDYVTNVDGRVDFGSTRMMRTQRSSGTIVSWPGLIAAHHLKDARKLAAIDKPTKAAMVHAVSHPHILKTASVSANIRIEKAKAIAEKYAGSTRSLNQVAAKIVIDRVMEAFGTDEPGEISLNPAV